MANWGPRYTPEAPVDVSAGEALRWLCWDRPLHDEIRRLRDDLYVAWRDVERGSRDCFRPEFLAKKPRTRFVTESTSYLTVYAQP